MSRSVIHENEWTLSMRQVADLAVEQHCVVLFRDAAVNWVESDEQWIVRCAGGLIQPTITLNRSRADRVLTRLSADTEVFTQFVAALIEAFTSADGRGVFGSASQQSIAGARVAVAMAIRAGQDWPLQRFAS